MSPEFLSQAAAFAAVCIYGSFFEWTLHRYFMHRRRRIVPYPFEKHALVHHVLFRADTTFHAQSDAMRKHVTFRPFDYLILLSLNAGVFLAFQRVTGLEILIGGCLGVLVYLGLFDSLHWMFHVPRNRRVEQWTVFKWLKQHHRLHHQYQHRNFNVVIPIADYLLGTHLAHGVSDGR